MPRQLAIATILGARPQFIKAAPVVHRLKALGHAETIIHTGQHYDSTMSDVFFRELDIPQPAYNLGVGSGLHGATTGAMMTGIEAILIDHRPDWVLVYGDTSATLAGWHASGGVWGWGGCSPCR